MQTVEYTYVRITILRICTDGSEIMRAKTKYKRIPRTNVLWYIINHWRENPLQNYCTRAPVQNVQASFTELRYCELY